MQELSAKDRKEIVSCLRRIYGATDLHSFRTTAIDAVAQLVASESTSYNEVNAGKGSFFSILEPVELQFAGCEEIFLAHVHEHPLVQHQQKSGHGGAQKLSDFLTQRQYHNLGIYADLYRRMGAEYQMSISLPSAPATIVALAVNRRSRDFDEKERSMINLIRPHLAQAYRNSHLASQLKRAIELNHLGVILVSARGRIKMSSSTAEHWLTEFFGWRPGQSRRLPEEVRRRVDDALSTLRDETKLPQPAAPWQIAKDGNSLLVHFLIDDIQGECLVLLERKQTQLSPTALESLGLGRREAEVLFWVAQGKTNAEVAAVLDLSQGTVKKHLDRVYEKLDVSNRLEATMCGLKALGLIADNP